MDKTKQKIIGIILILIGLFMLFKSVHVYSFNFYRINGISTAGIILVLLCISGVSLVVKRNKFTIGLVILSLLALVLSIILGTKISFYGITLLDIILMLIPLIFGVGFVISSYLKK